MRGGRHGRVLYGLAYARTGIQNERGSALCIRDFERESVGLVGEMGEFINKNPLFLEESQSFIDVFIPVMISF
jgi:hypothetical protein